VFQKCIVNLVVEEARFFQSSSDLLIFWRMVFFWESQSRSCCSA